MIIFEREETYDEQILREEEERRVYVEKSMKRYRKTLEERKRGIYKSIGEIMEEAYYDSLGVEDQMEYDEKRRVRKLFEELSKQQRPA